MGLTSNLLLWMPLGLQGIPDRRNCDRVRTFVRPVHAADTAPLAGMVMRGPGPHLQERARDSEKVSGLPDPDRFDHLPIRIMTSSQLSRPDICGAPD
jgi:hypothetical protein